MKWDHNYNDDKKMTMVKMDFIHFINGLENELRKESVDFLLDRFMDYLYLNNRSKYRFCERMVEEEKISEFWNVAKKHRLCGLIY